MKAIKEELINKMNRALELEHAARIQYLTHAEFIKGIQSEPLIERLKEIASDEQKHEEKFRTLISDYLGGEPSMKMAETKKAFEINEILEINFKAEKEAIDFYKEIYFTIMENKKEFPYEFEMMEHEIRHIIIEEQEHATELYRLLGK